MMEQICSFLWTRKIQKGIQLQGASPSPDPHLGLCLWTPAVGAGSGGEWEKDEKKMRKLVKNTK